MNVQIEIKNFKYIYLVEKMYDKCKEIIGYDANEKRRSKLVIKKENVKKPSHYGNQNIIKIPDNFNDELTLSAISHEIVHVFFSDKVIEEFKERNIGKHQKEIIIDKFGEDICEFVRIELLKIIQDVFIDFEIDEDKFPINSEHFFYNILNKDKKSEHRYKCKKMLERFFKGNYLQFNTLMFLDKNIFLREILNINKEI